jgi:hypothetical protein
MKPMPYRIVLFINWADNHIGHLLTAIIFAVFAYFAEIKGAIHVMWASFIIDLMIGILVSVRIRKQRISIGKAFVAFERMAVATAVVLLLYAMDKEMGQTFVKSYNIVAWIICGFMVYSILENGYKLTRSRFLIALKSLINKKVQDNTGVDIEKEINYKQQ